MSLPFDDLLDTAFALGLQTHPMFFLFNAHFRHLFRNSFKQQTGFRCSVHFPFGRHSVDIQWSFDRYWALGTPKPETRNLSRSQEMGVWSVPKGPLFPGGVSEKAQYLLNIHWMKNWLINPLFGVSLL